MKITREARRDARKLFRLCLVDGRVDEGRVRAAVQKVAQAKPRGYASLLARFQKLLQIEVEKRTFAVESAVELADKGASALADLEKKFGKPLATRYAVNPALLGGVLLRVGSHVWDGTVRNRLRALTPTSN